MKETDDRIAAVTMNPYVFFFLSVHDISHFCCLYDTVGVYFIVAFYIPTTESYLVCKFFVVSLSENIGHF